MRLPHLSYAQRTALAFIGACGALGACFGLLYGLLRG